MFQELHFMLMDLEVGRCDYLIVSQARNESEMVLGRLLV
jgi:hypothetical protein